MANEVNIDPRYMKYDKEDVEALLEKVENADSAPTADSENMITSGAVKAALDEKADYEENSDPMSLFDDDDRDSSVSSGSSDSSAGSESSSSGSSESE